MEGAASRERSRSRLTWCYNAQWAQHIHLLLLHFGFEHYGTLVGIVFLAGAVASAGVNPIAELVLMGSALELEIICYQTQGSPSLLGVL